MRKILVVLIALCSCTSIEDPANARHRPPPPPVDAAPPPPMDAAPMIDAPVTGTAGWASCYNSGDPTASVNLATNFCCFDEIDSPNNGWAEPLSGAFGNCTRSWNTCDGNEDCAAGTTCTAHLQQSTLYPPALIFAIECRATLPAGDRQLCHPGDGTCPAGTACVLGQGDQVQWYGLPPIIYVCN